MLYIVDLIHKYSLNHYLYFLGFLLIALITHYSEFNYINPSELKNRQHWANQG